MLACRVDAAVAKYNCGNLDELLESGLGSGSLLPARNELALKIKQILASKSSSYLVRQ